MRVLGIGESIIDNIYQVDNPNISEDKLHLMMPKKHVGGPVPAALVVLSRLGIKCTFVTSLGRDDEADIIKRELKHEKIKVIGKIQKKTKVNTILVPRSTGQRVKLRGNVTHAPIKDLDRNFLRQFDLIIMDRHEKTAFYEVMKKKRSTTKILIDPSTEISTFTLDMIKLADYPIIPIESLIKICSDGMVSCLKKLYETTHKPLIITAGELGSIVYDGKESKLLRPYHIKPVDTLGAGDVYRGAFAYGVIQGWELSECATFGNFVAGLQCTKLGNLAAIPSKDEMLLFRAFTENNDVTMPIVHEYFSSLYQTA